MTDTPAVCGDRRNSAFGMFDCDQPTGHGGDHGTRVSADEWTTWPQDATPRPAPDTPDSHTVRNGTFLHGGPPEGCTLPGCATAPVAVTVTASDVLVQHDVTRKAMCDALGEGWHLNWQQIIDAARRTRVAAEEETRDAQRARQGEAEAIRARTAAEQRERDAERGVTNIRNEYEALLERWRQACEELRGVKDSAGKTAATLRETENQLGETRQQLRQAQDQIANQITTITRYADRGIENGERADRNCAAWRSARKRAAHWIEQVGIELGQRTRAEATLAAIRELHANDQWHCGVCADEYGSAAPWPCPTAAALGDPQPAAEALLLIAPCTGCGSVTARCDPKGRFLCLRCDSIEQVSGVQQPAAPDDCGAPKGGVCVHDLAEPLPTVHGPMCQGCTKCTAKAEVCCVCGCPDVTYHNFREQPFCCRCAECCEPPVLCAHGCQPPTKTEAEADDQPAAGDRPCGETQRGSHGGHRYMLGGKGYHCPGGEVSEQRAEPLLRGIDLAGYTAGTQAFMGAYVRAVAPLIDQMSRALGLDKDRR